MSANTQQSKLSSKEFDVLVVGTGFSGSIQLYRLRKAGFKVKAFEAGSTTGGVWYWNCYPGARVDSDFSIYQYSMEEVWRDWNWTERFPGQKEIIAYFKHVDEKLDLSRDILFDTRVIAANFDTRANRWIVSTQNGITVYPRFLILCTGFAAKPLLPDYKGFESFKGRVYHTSLWPQEGVELRGKRIGVIGTGASGVQVIQECGPESSHLTVFQRTPNLTLPMVQRKVDRKMQDKMKEDLYYHIFRRREQTAAGFHYESIGKRLGEVSIEERYLLFEELWGKGGFHYLAGNFIDISSDQSVNDEVYRFWRKKVRERINDPEMQEKLAPTVPPHPIGAKRPSLEQHYYEVYNLPHVELVDLQVNPITEITPSGVKTQDGVEHEFDVLVLATGFDALTGSISQIDIRDTDGVLIRDRWAKGLSTYLGLMCTNLPNAFFVYGPQSPTAFCNGPTCAELQSEWVTNCICYMRANHFTRIEPTQEAEDAYVNIIAQIFSTQLLSRAKSWYTGANVPGKPIQSLNFLGGLQLYLQMCRECAGNGYKGFEFLGQDKFHSAQSNLSTRL